MKMPKRKILVVDDEAALTRALRRNLEATGDYEVREVNRGADALEAAKVFRPDLILLDVMMPDRDGGDIAAEIKESSDLAATPIVFLTAAITREEAGSKGKRIAGRRFLAKPVKTRELVHCIESELGPTP